jgi:hypothetical protein
MGIVGNFVASSIISLVLLAGTSLIWPRFTDQPRPKILEDVKSVVMKTSVGKDASNVLGVSDEKNLIRIDPGKIVQGAVGQMTNAVEQRIQTIIVSNAVSQLQLQFEKLLPDQKEQIRQIICKPLEEKPNE